jgi:hypothetical protein
MNIVCLHDELHDYDIEALEQQGYDEIIYHYTNDHWEGYGQLIGLKMENGRIRFEVQELGHCSCYSPSDNGVTQVYTAKELNDMLFSDNVLDSRDLHSEIADFIRKSTKAAERRLLEEN